MSAPDILFKGIPRAPTRGYTARVIAAVKPDRVVIPCTGSFSLAYVAREAGVQRIVAGDISLYSTAIGNAIMGKDWRLELKADNELADVAKPFLTDPVSKAAAVLLMVRILQYVRPTEQVFHLHRRRELARNAIVYIEQLREQIEQLRVVLKGVEYVAQDMWLTMEEYLDPGAVCLCNPPRYTGGYDRMFRGIDQLFDWDEPEASQFTEADYSRLMDFLKGKPALSLMYYATQGEDPAPQWGEPWKSVFADRPGNLGAKAAINWIIANRDPAGVEASRARIQHGEAKFPLFEGEIKPTSHIHAVKVDKITGDYYRDLFIHKLPGSMTEIYVGLLLDGRLMGIIGLHLADLRRGKKVKKGEKVLDHCASVTFAFTCPHPAYDRLHKLTLMSITSGWFWGDVLGKENWYELNGAPRHVKTTMLTPYPENKTCRGIMALDTRVQEKDGSYKLTYSTATNERSREDTLREWLRKFAPK